jgi:uncharacterized protein GlcG (DUF336 family)
VQILSIQAEALIRAATAEAARLAVAVSVVVLDAGGQIKAFSRMDGAWLGSIDVAFKKARTSVLFEAETQLIWEVCRPGAQAHGLESTNDGLVTFAGGIPLRSSDGQLLGAVGVSGGQVVQDYTIAQVAVAAMNS